MFLSTVERVFFFIYNFFWVLEEKNTVHSNFVLDFLVMSQLFSIFSNFLFHLLTG